MYQSLCSHSQDYGLLLYTWSPLDTVCYSKEYEKIVSVYSVKEIKQFSPTRDIISVILKQESGAHQGALANFQGGHNKS